jgi:hypothetical protein
MSSDPQHCYEEILKGTVTRKIGVQVWEPEHHLDLKDEPPTRLKISRYFSYIHSINKIFLGCSSSENNHLEHHIH